jgi:hypothetical protein
MVTIYETYLTTTNSASEIPYTTQHIAELLEQYDPISLAEMENVSLLDRIDTKYVMGLSHFYRAIA